MLQKKTLIDSFIHSFIHVDSITKAIMMRFLDSTSRMNGRRQFRPRCRSAQSTKAISHIMQYEVIIVFNISGLILYLTHSLKFLIPLVIKH